MKLLTHATHSRVAATITVLAVLAVAPPAFAQGGGGGTNKAGRATIWQGSCKYGVFGPRGVLQVGVPAPRVSGANTRRGTRRERTSVRYRVYVTNAFTGSTFVASSWSSFIRVRESGRGTWSGPTVFDMVWQGNYGADIRVEWWSAGRRIGWRAYSTPAFRYFDQYNRGPFGPISSCYKYTTY